MASRILVPLAALALIQAPLGCESASPAEGPVPAASAQPVDEAALANVTLTVEGMVCEGCQSSIQDAVGKLPGVKSCAASHEKGQAKVRYDPALIDPAKLAAAINELGYKAAAPTGDAVPQPAPDSATN